MDDLREKVIRGLECCLTDDEGYYLCEKCSYAATDEDRTHVDWACHKTELRMDALELLKAQEADESKYEYHTDHTDCIWYMSGEKSRCPATCSQYRDGWNDAMNYIFRNGDGYRPYERIRKGR